MSNEEKITTTLIPEYAKNLQSAPIVKFYIKEIISNILKNLTLKTRIRGQYFTFSTSIPFEVYAVIFKAIRDSKRPGVVSQVFKDRQTTITNGFLTTFQLPIPFEEILTDLAETTFTGKRTHGSNKVKLQINPDHKVCFRYNKKTEKLSVKCFYIIVNQFGNVVDF
jgi:hypothetical protein